MQVQQAHAPFELTVEELTEWTQRPHQHNFFELVYIEEGEGLQCINHQYFPYQAGNIFLLPPLDCHAFRVAIPTRFVFLRFTQQFFAARGSGVDLREGFQQLSYVLLNYNRIPGDSIRSEPDRQHLVHNLQLVRAEYAKNDPLSSTLIQSALLTILNLLSRHVEAALLDAPPSEAVRDPRFVRVLNHIQHALFRNELLRVAALAEWASMSPTYFSEYFRHHAGETLQVYITRSRLQVAEARLLHSTASIKEIAAELGFTDASHLSRTFKKYYGCTIQQFRQRGSFRRLSSPGCSSAADDQPAGGGPTPAGQPE